MELANKTILIISPQAWGEMFISKNHYAIELAKRGNLVYFLNPPDQQGKEKIFSVTITPVNGYANLMLISHRLWYPYNLKFHALGLFQMLMQVQLKKIVKKIGKELDIIWSFDLGHLYPFKYFSKKAFKIFHPVDEPLDGPSIRAAEGADIIFSVTNEILEKYQHLKVPTHFINHGVSEDFITDMVIKDSSSVKLHVGFSGNLLRTDLDHPTLLKIVTENPDIQFEFWGSYKESPVVKGNGTEQEANIFVRQLKALPNATLHGAINPKHLAKALPEMDAFLICYDVQKDQSRGTNYHKIMEYLATGKIIISNNITTYKDRPDLIQMVQERDSNIALPTLFKTVMQQLNYFNSGELVSNRKRFASENTYRKQIERIEMCLKGQLN